MAATSALAIDASQSPQDAAPQNEQAVALVSNGVAARPAGDPSCPSVTLAPDGDTRRADGAKATLDGLARDCANLGAETIVKVALVGESERKKEDGPAAFDAPMTIQIKDGQGRDVETRRINLKVEMPEGVQRVSFRHVEENVSLPPPSADGYANWTIVVGLDPSSEPETPVAVVEEDEAEKPAKSIRSSKARKSRYARSRATRRARDVAARRTPAPDPNPVVVTAKPQGQPVQIVTTTNSGSPMNKVAESARVIRDKATFDRQVKELQQNRARRGLPPVPVEAVRRQSAPGPQAVRQRQAANGQVRTAQQTN